MFAQLFAAESSRRWQVNHPYFSPMSELCEMQVDLSAPSQKVALRLGRADSERVVCARLSDSRARRSNGGSELNYTPGKRGETSGGGAFSRALLSDRREQDRREELQMLDRATILKDWPLAILDQGYLRLNVRIAFTGSLRNNDVDAVVPFRKRSLPFLRHLENF